MVEEIDVKNGLLFESRDLASDSDGSRSRLRSKSLAIARSAVAQRRRTAVRERQESRSSAGVSHRCREAYSLAELIDLAEAHNPETRVAWESARSQAAALGIARSELYPTLSAVALAGVDRQEVPLGTRFYRFTVPAAQTSLELIYAISGLWGSFRPDRGGERPTAGGELWVQRRSP